MVEAATFNAEWTRDNVTRMGGKDPTRMFRITPESVKTACCVRLAGQDAASLGAPGCPLVGKSGGLTAGGRVTGKGRA